MTRIVDSGELGGSKSRSQAALVSCSWMIQSPPAAAFCVRGDEGCKEGGRKYVRM